MNNIKLYGVVKTEPVFSHNSKGEDFFKFELEVIRRSGNSDILNCVIPSCYADRIKADDSVELDGEIRTRNEIVNEETDISKAAVRGNHSWNMFLTQNLKAPKHRIHWTVLYIS